MDYHFSLIFPAERVAGVLLAVGQMGTGESTSRTLVTLPGGRAVLMPFASWAGNDGSVSLAAGTKVRLDAFLHFPDDEHADPGQVRSVPPYLRLWVFMGKRYAQISLFAGSPDMGGRFLTSPSIHAALTGLLERHQGVIGLLDIGEDEVYLLPDLHRYIVAPNALAYYDTRHCFDVDRWTSDLLMIEIQEAERPVYWMRGQVSGTPGSKMDRALEGALGGWREPIPERYHRAFEGRPFDTCDFCRRPLLVPGTQYVVSKVYTLGELQQETVMCDGCRAELTAHDSDESRQTMERIFETVRRSERLATAALRGTDRAERMTERCVLCGLPKAGADWYIEHARCESNEIVYYMHPFVVCHTCTLRIHDQLSEQTRGERGRFYERHFGFPPPWKPRAEIETGLGMESPVTHG
jgi:hypothetical protein